MRLSLSNPGMLAMIDEAVPKFTGKSLNWKNRKPDKL